MTDSEILQAKYDGAMLAMGEYLAACELYNTPTEELKEPEWYDRNLVIDRICENEELLADIVTHFQAAIKKG
jgi:hypothetical protein